ncbi:unnamed protein product [Boreogadus saida]
MKEIELELRRLELKEREISSLREAEISSSLREKEISLKEKEMTCHFEVKKLEEETKRVVRLKELELEIGVAVPSLSTA